MSNVVSMYEWKRNKVADDKMRRIIENAKAIKADRDKADLECEMHKKSPRIADLLTLLKGDSND